jgi:DNA-binding FadR family transcriptional regulator
MENTFVPVGARPTFEGAVAQIAERIRRGDLVEGDRLPTERDLAAAMEISRPTVREAVRVLSDAGVLTVKPGSSGGIYVTSSYVPLEAPFEPMRLKADLRPDEVAGVLEARRLLEPRVAQLASMNALEDDFSRLQAIIDAQRTLAESGEETKNLHRFFQLDTQFHLRIAAATRNATVVLLMQLLQRQLEIVRGLFLREPPLACWVIGVHEKTLAAIRSGDRQTIEIVMDEHLAALERGWERETGSVLVRPIPDFLRPIGERALTGPVLRPSDSSPSPGQRDNAGDRVSRPTRSAHLECLTTP